MNDHGASLRDRAGGPADLSRCASQPEALTPSAGLDWYRLLPWYWFQNEPTDRYWDAVLNSALDHFRPVVGYCTAKVGPFEVWAENWPYVFGNNYGDGKNGLPMVRTRLRLRRMLREGDGSIAARLASAIEARRAETGTGSVHESAVPQADAQPSDIPEDSQ